MSVDRSRFLLGIEPYTNDTKATLGRQDMLPGEQAQLPLTVMGYGSPMEYWTVWRGYVEIGLTDDGKPYVDIVREGP